MNTKRKIWMMNFGILSSLLLVNTAFGQTGIGTNQTMESVLSSLYDEMMPMCSSLISVGRSIAGFAALWYIASRVWRHIANAEPVNFYPLLRPFVLGFAILIFPLIIEMINGVLNPIVKATSEMVAVSDQNVQELLDEKQQALQQTGSWQLSDAQIDQLDPNGSNDGTVPLLDSTDAGIFSSIGDKLSWALQKQNYRIHQTIDSWFSQFLQIIYSASSVCINTLRTFNLIILAILGPLVFGISVFDGFQHSVNGWLARYINIFLWLPVANIFGALISKIEENMLRLDIVQIHENGSTFFSKTDLGYLVFLVIGIIGYFSVPSIANHILPSGRDALSSKTSALTEVGAGVLISSVYSSNNYSGSGARNFHTTNHHSFQAGNYYNSESATSASPSNYTHSGGYMQDKLKGDNTNG